MVIKAKSEYTCPHCNASIALNDVNVATDIALCRACGETNSFALISGTAAVTSDALLHTPKHITLSKDLLNGTVITYRKSSAILLFLIPFTALWSGGSMWGIYGTQINEGRFDLFQSLFGLPFLFGSVVLLSVIIFLLFGRWVITLHKNAGRVFLGVGPFGWTRHFIYDGNSVVSLRGSSVKVNNVPQQIIHIRNGNSEFQFGSTLTPEAKQYIAATIHKEAGAFSSNQTFI
jgi:hypothetical protein